MLAAEVAITGSGMIGRGLARKLEFYLDIAAMAASVEAIHWLYRRIELQS